MRTRLFTRLIRGSVVLGLLTCALDQGRTADGNPQAFFQKYCVSCHGDGPEVKGEFDLRPLLASESLTPHLGKWHDVMDTLDFREMPPAQPAHLPKPTSAEYEATVAWLESAMSQAEGAPRRYTRRLNRAQYNHTVRDLLGIDVNPADAFPQDLGEEGFDTVARVQSMSPYLWERYAEAARQLVSLAAAPEEAVEPFTTRYFPLDRDQRDGKSKIASAEIDLQPLLGKKKRESGQNPLGLMNLDHKSGSPGSKGGVRPGKGAHGYEVVLKHEGNASRRGEIKFKNLLPYGRYQLKFKAYAELGRDRDGQPLEPFDACLAGVYVNGVLAQEFSVPITETPQNFELAFNTDFASTTVRIAANSQVNGSQRKAVPSLVLCEAEIEGPLFDSWPPAPHRALFGSDLDAPPSEWLPPFLSRAFRRPATVEEVARYTGVYQSELDAGATPREAALIAAQAVLVSPSFLYLVEEERPGGQLNDFEFASRLSYFLWASMPDEELFRLAAEGRLRQPDLLRAQVARMLDDPKAEALTKEFAGQWLALRRISEIVPDPDLFKTFDEELRKAMRGESEAFFREVLTRNLPIRTFLASDFTFANQRLARHYDLPPLEGGEMRRVALSPDDLRGGLVTQSGILSVFSQQTRSSPVMRGVFVLEKLFNRPPPNPPANVPPLEEPEPGEEISAGNLREQMERHAADPACAGCHTKIDPWGLALEEFNAIGAFRTVDPGDVTTELYDGTSMVGVRGLKAELLRRETDFARGLTEKLLTYGLGRTLTPSDRQAVDAILAQSAQADHGLKALILSVIESPVFQTH